jgi:ubiquinone/menaquinone biosynthesis C-methylase UbiE
MQDIKRVKKYYDSYWAKHNVKKQERSNLRTYEKEAISYAFQSLRQHFPRLKNKKILEIGPGKGHELLQFVKLGANVTAIDISKNSLELSKELLDKHNLSSKVKFIQMDAHNLRFKKNQFDIVFLQSILMHLEPMRVAKQCRRVLKNNGVFLSIEPIDGNPLIKLYRLIFSEFKETHPKYISHQQIIEISKLFRTAQIKGFYLFSFACLIFGRDNFFYRLACIILKSLENILLLLFPSLEKKALLYVSVNIK